MEGTEKKKRGFVVSNGPDNAISGKLSPQSVSIGFKINGRGGSKSMSRQRIKSVKAAGSNETWPTRRPVQ